MSSLGRAALCKLRAGVRAGEKGICELVILSSFPSSHTCMGISSGSSFTFNLKKDLHIFSYVEIERFLGGSFTECEKATETKSLWANILSYSRFSWNHHKLQLHGEVLAADVICSYCHGGFYHVHLYQQSIFCPRNTCRDCVSEVAALNMGVSILYKRGNIHPSANFLLSSCHLLLLSWTKLPDW